MFHPAHEIPCVYRFCVLRGSHRQSILDRPVWERGQNSSTDFFVFSSFLDKVNCSTDYTRNAFCVGGGGWRLEEHRRSSATDLMCFDTAHSIVFARCFPSLALSHYLYTQALELPPAGRWLLLLLHSLRSEREPLSHPIVAIAPLDGITTWGHDLSTLKRYLRVYPFPLGFTPSFHSWIHSWHDITSVYSTFFDSGIRSIVNSFTPHCLYCGHFQRFVTFNFYQHLWRLKTNPKLTGGTIVLIFVICIPVNWFGCAVQH